MSLSPTQGVDRPWLTWWLYSWTPSTWMDLVNHFNQSFPPEKLRIWNQHWGVWFRCFSLFFFLGDFQVNQPWKIRESTLFFETKIGVPMERWKFNISHVQRMNLIGPGRWKRGWVNRVPDESCPVPPPEKKRGGDFSDFLFSPRKLGKWSNLTNIFQLFWNHQLGKETDEGFCETVVVVLNVFDIFTPKFGGNDLIILTHLFQFGLKSQHPKFKFRKCERRRLSQILQVETKRVLN